MADLPIGESTDLLDGELQHVGERVHLVGRGRDLFQKLDLTLAFVKLAQPFLGNRLGLEPRLALAFETAVQPLDFRRVADGFNGHGPMLVRAHVC